jgi:hypothetical protein
VCFAGVVAAPVVQVQGVPEVKVGVVVTGQAHVGGGE